MASTSLLYCYLFSKMSMKWRLSNTEHVHYLKLSTDIKSEEIEKCFFIIFNAH